MRKFLGLLCLLLCSSSSAFADELDTVIDYLVETREAELAKLAQVEREAPSEEHAQGQARARLRETFQPEGRFQSNGGNPSGEQSDR